MPSIPQTDALSEAHPSSIEDLFSRNPTAHTQADIDQLILYYRNLRESLASSATIRHTRVPKQPQAYEADFSSLL